MKKSLLVLFVFAFIAQTAYSQTGLQSPEDFLGYKLGDRFTRHHKVVEYYQHVAGEMSNVKLEQYGETNENRPLVVAFISSQANFDRLEEIRENNLKRTGLVDGTATDENISIVWLSYNVHGNESSSTEATMQTLYELADPTNSNTQAWLENTVVIMDPCINPDGRDRYANFFNQYANKTPNPNLDSKEHNEPWPGGRANHYLFDLNRDWAWLTQIESQQRLKMYNQWMPHVHVDFHEQNMNSPYYFAPASQPYHEIITSWQNEFQAMIGKNHAKYFDQEGWLYFTKEVFDLFYPSYGDTYPMYNGAIGMTYEKGGGGRAGLAGLLANGDTITLDDRLTHHHTTGLSTVEVSSVNADRLVNEFAAYYSKAQSNPSSTYKSFVIKGSNHPDKLKMLTEWLDKHQIVYGSGSSSNSRLTGFSYQTGNTSPVRIEPGDMIVSAYQPKSNLVTALFEPNSKLVDSATYDITAWAIPYVYGLDSYALTDRINVSSEFSLANTSVTVTGSDNTYAFVTRYESLIDVKWVAWLLKKGVQLRSAQQDFSVEGENYKKGTILALRWDNYHVDGFSDLIKEAAVKFGQDTKAVSTGLVNQGKDFGSRYYRLIKVPEIAILGGDQSRSLDFGQVWYHFEQDLDYPVTVLDTDYFSRVDLSKYDVLVVPGGFYRVFNENKRKDLASWVRDGGKLVIIGSALRSFVDTDQFGLTTFGSEDEKKASEKEEKERDEAEILMRNEDARRNSLKDGMPGSIYRVKMDNSHPLAFGYSDNYFTLKLGSARYAYLKEGSNVGVIDSENDHVSGYVGSNVKPTIAETLVFGVENMGRGSVVYMVDNPLFRAFWQNGKMVFGNAVFMQ